MSDSEYIFCQNCGARIPASVKFCNKCGTKNEYALAADGSLVKAQPAPSQAAQNANVSYDAAPEPQKPVKKKKGILIAVLILAVAMLAFSIAGLAGAFSKGDSEPEAPITDPAPSTDPVPPGNGGGSSDGISGCIIIEDGPIHIRTGASTAADNVGNAYNAEAYDVYEIKTAGGYTWYRIGEDRWVASNGTWARYIEGGRASQYPPGKIMAGSYVNSENNGILDAYQDVLTINADGTCTLYLNTGEGMTTDSCTYRISEGMIYVTPSSDSYLMQYYGWSNQKVTNVVFAINNINSLELTVRTMYSMSGDCFVRK